MDKTSVSCAGVATLLKPHKAADPERVPARILKELAQRNSACRHLTFPNLY